MQKSKGVAILLSLFGGMAGLHKFYLNEPGAGIFYFILTFIVFGTFKFPITMLLGIMDAMKLMSMSTEQFDKKYNSYEGRTNESRRRASRGRTSRKASNTQSREIRRREIERERYRMSSQPKRQRKNPFKSSAYKKYKDFDLEDAIQDYEKALEISPNDKDIHFNMAAVYSLLEKKQKSYFHIEEALRLGFRKKEDILTMDDFAYLRIQEDFEMFKNSGFSSKEIKSIEPPKSDLLQDDLLLSQLNKLKEMRDRGLLSEKEFVYEKEKLGRK